jgi:hypothetical protein
MSMPSPSRSATAPRSTLAAILRTVALATVLLLPVAILMGAFDKLAVPGARRGSDPSQPISGALDNAARLVRSLAPSTDALAIAAEATPEGHWRFVSRAGEVFTAGTAEEMKRAVPLLHPYAKAGNRLLLYLTEGTIFRQAKALKALPPNAELFVVVGEESYRLVRSTDGPVDRIFAEVRPLVAVEMADRRLFSEAVWQLERPLSKVGVRVLALEPGGPLILSASPRIDPASRRPLIDVVDPGSLAAAMGGVGGQTLLITGRIEGDQLYFKPASGGERSLPLKELFRAAEAADVNMILLHAAQTPRQPGGRNWLWQRVEVAGLEQALQRSRLADFLNGLGAPNRRMMAIALPVGGRALFDLAPGGDHSSAPSAGAVGDFFSAIVADLTGRVVAAGVKANLRSAERQQEFDQRFVPGVPAIVQHGYLALVFLGLFGVPLSRTWWARVWPPEVAAEYAGRTGLWAARAARALAYALVFIPVTAVVAAPTNLATQIWDGIATPVRWWRRVFAARSESVAAQRPRQAPAANPRLPPTQPGSERDWPTLDAPRLGRHVPNR